MALSDTPLPFPSVSNSFDQGLDCGERNALFVEAKLIDAAFHKSYCTLPQACIHFLFEPGMGITLWVFGGRI